MRQHVHSNAFTSRVHAEESADICYCPFQQCEHELFQHTAMSLGTARLDDLRRRSSVTRLEMSPGNNNLPVLNGPDRQTGRYVCNIQTDGAELPSSVSEAFRFFC